MKTKYLFPLLILYFSSVSIYAQVIWHVEPPNWWTHMVQDTLQIMVHGNNISEYEVTSETLQIIQTTSGDSPNYIFIDILIKRADVGNHTLRFNSETESLEHIYEIKSRSIENLMVEGFNSSDVVYLITPDRFANGNPSNDIVEDMREKQVNRAQDYARHGGDIEGIINHLDYIDEMGFTAIWSSPLLINDMPQWSYHGYAITDYYQVDPRFGTLKDYINLANEGRKRGLKLIMDMIANHCGLNHWWMQDKPFEDWINRSGEYMGTNHRRTTNQDPYAATKDRQLMSEGWFVPQMPDLNQRNPYMARYIIQNSIWWIETLGLAGIRQDTYPYPDKTFMSDWAKAIMDEYPNFSIVGEEWSYNPLLIAYWQQGNQNSDGYQSNLKSSMDFAMQKTIVDGIKEDEAWHSGFVKMYEGLANDFHYYDPKSLMIFGDNHDMDRIYTQLEQNVVNTKMALAYILMLPRIPQIYYGTELLFDNSSKPGDHGLIRSDFLGGWEGDTSNAITGNGLDPVQKDMQSFLKKILNYRKASTPIHSGNTLHFAPEDGVYVLFRYNREKVIMLIMNKNEETYDLQLARFSELIAGQETAIDVLSETEIGIEDAITLSERGVKILEFKND